MLKIVVRGESVMFLPLEVNAGHAGIRTDFMDVELDAYKIAEQ